MGKLRDLINRVSERFFTKRKTELSENTVPLFRYDRMTVDNEVSSNPEFAELVREGEADHPGFQNLVQDLFGSLYKENPDLLPEEEIAEEYRVNRQHMADVMESEEYDQLRSNTRLNESLALASSQELARRILAASPEESEDRNRVRDLEQDLRELIDEAEEAEARGADEDELEALAEEIEDTEGDLEQLLSQVARRARSDTGMKRRIQSEISRQAEQTETLMQLLRSFGYTKDQLARVSTDTMVKMLRDVIYRPELKKMADLIGRFRRIANRLLRKSKQKEHFVITGVNVGDDIKDITSREVMCALHPGTRPDFVRRWQDGELEVYEREDEVESGKGPMVVCVDVSGSMQGEKDAYAKALLMAYLEIAKKEHRDITVIFFDNYLQEEYRIKRGRVRPDTLIDILSFFTGGGTDFEYPLGRSAEIIARESSMKAADILFVTDGSAHVSPEFLDHFRSERDRLGFKVISAFVETEGGWNREGCVELLKSFSTAVFDVRELTDETAEQIIGSVLES